ncbi:hypothetical protein [Aquimarina sp. 2201CG14-23]|nr:hypothetical protein [Aquimarina sp. 2201CG14-23]MDH7448216.1 hypothetical protein [Aquimarina sp. 2201CG14-23]
MKNNFLNIEGVKILKKEIQKTVNGGYAVNGCDCGVTSDMQFLCPYRNCD